MTALPRVVLAAPASGHGKTTVATGLMAALRNCGRKVAGFKIGPDYIDPGYHFLATDRPGRNLDPHLCGPETLVPLLLHGAAMPQPADVAIIEGVMGLFDGQIGGEGFASTAHVASLTQSPVIVVLDVSHLSRTAAAIVHGLRTFDPGLRLAGVILNKAGSDRHAEEITSALEAIGVEVLGVLPRDAGIEVPSRHLGLVPAAERSETGDAVRRLGARIADHVPLGKIMTIASAAPPLPEAPWDPATLVTSVSTARPVVAVAAGRAFTFRYPETDELLRAAGCDPVILDPLTDPQLPQGTAGLYLGGGFPEVHAAGLSDNAPLRQDLAAAIEAGIPTVAECAGLLYLCRRLDGFPMVGALPTQAVMTERLTLRYRSAVADHDHLLAAAETRVTGHEFHRTIADPSAGVRAGWLVDGEPVGFSLDPAGTGRPTVHASYLHVHWAGHPQLAQRFADAVHSYAAQAKAEGCVGAGKASAEPVEAQRVGPSTGSGPINLTGSGPIDSTSSGSMNLRYHGDQEMTNGFVDLAVNVRIPTPPRWLIETINETIAELAAYPQPDEAIAAIAAAHGLRDEQVLPTAGGAEAFTLIARAAPGGRPVVVHPQFTEPEAALLAAGCQPSRLILAAENGFRFDCRPIPTDADLIMIGNPTNPTSVLHSAAAIRSLLRPGRLVVVDEAFMDAVPGEAESMIGGEMTGLVVIRSLTKTWGLAGLRAGYAVGDPSALAAMREQQPPWPVSTPALAAMAVCLSDEARAMASLAAQQTAENRAVLIECLTELGLEPAGSPAAPFVLVDTGLLRAPAQPPGWVREALRERGFAVRRGDTFPGLGPDWIRIAVRDPQISRKLADALRVIDCGSARM